MGLVKLLIFVLAVYVGFMFAFPAIKFKIYENAAVKRIDEVPEERLVKALVTAAQETGVPVQKENIKFDEYAEGKTIIIKYDDVISFPFVKKEYVYHRLIKRELPKKGGEE